MGNSQKTRKPENQGQTGITAITSISEVENRINITNDYSILSSNDTSRVTRIKNSLKYLHKNNFTALTYVWMTSNNYLGRSKSIFHSGKLEAACNKPEQREKEGNDRSDLFIFR